MAKTAKAAANTAAQNSGKDLFSDLPEAAPRRLAGKAARAGRPTGGADARYTARDIEVLEASSRSVGAQACISAAPTKRRCTTFSRR